MLITPGEANLKVPGPKMYQVGSEGGFLPAVAVHPNGIPCTLDLKSDPTGNTALAPAERADVIIDFNGAAGSSFILYADAPAPFPGGAMADDPFGDGSYPLLRGFARDNRNRWR